MHIPIARRSEWVPAPSPPAFQMIFIGSDALGMPPVFSNAREYVNCGNMQAKRSGFIVLQKRFLLITCLNSKAVRLLFYKAGERGRWGWWEEEEGETKKKRGKKRESEGKEGEREGAQRMHFKVSPAIGWGGAGPNVKS